MKLRLREFSEKLNIPFGFSDEDFTETEISQAFGKSLKALRLHKGLSLNALSERIDVPNPTINRYENGINIPTITQALKISLFFNLSIEEMIIFGLSDPKNGTDIITYYENKKRNTLV